MGDVLPFPGHDADDPESGLDPEFLLQVREGLRKAADSGDLQQSVDRHPSGHQVPGVIDLAEHRKADEHTVEQLVGRGLLPRGIIVVSVPDGNEEDNDPPPLA